MEALNRRLAALCIVLVVMAISAASAGAAPASAAGVEYRGVHLHSLWEDSSNADMDRELDLARGTGANVVRTVVGWDSLETGGKGRYSEWYVEKLDRFVNGANARGMKVIATLSSTPCWASSAPAFKKQNCEGEWWGRNVQVYPPNNPADYGDAARWVTARYGTKLAALEVWNEPNLEEDRFFVAPDEPRAYAGMLKAAYAASKRANPQVDVLAGSLAYMNGGFLQKLYSLGVKGHYDGLAVHPYNDGAPSKGDWSGIEWIRKLQAAAGDNTPLWLTEFGWSTCREGSGWCKSPAEQARNTKAGFATLGSEANVKGAIVYNLRDVGTDSGDMEANFGLVTRGFKPKPAYYAMRAALRGTHASPVARKPRARVRLRVRRRATRVVAFVKAPRGMRVSIATIRCDRTRSRRLILRTGRSGRARRTVGRASRLRGCQVTAKLRGAARVVASRRVS